jgi:ABC-type nitrate/sulfonate/bicarbonate transport system substrate-binding protein
MDEGVETDPVYMAIVRAYQRGAEWMKENPDDFEYVTKAAFDYADKVTAVVDQK